MGLQQAFILGAVRSPIGRYRGALKDVRPDDLLAQVLGEAYRLDEGYVDEISMGLLLPLDRP